MKRVDKKTHPITSEFEQWCIDNGLLVEDENGLDAEYEHQQVAFNMVKRLTSWELAQATSTVRMIVNIYQDLLVEGGW